MEINIDDKGKQLVSAAEALHGQIAALQARTPFEYEKVAQFVKDAKGQFNTLEGHRKYLKEPYLEGGRRVDEFFAKPLQFAKAAEDAGKRVLLGYEQEQRRIADEENRKLQEKASKEREALEAKARAEREEADRKAKELERKAAEARAAGDAAAAVTLTHKANQVLDKADAKAESIQIKAAQVVAPKVAAYIPPIVGQSTKTIWRARVVDASLVPRDYLVVDESLLANYAKAMKDKAKVPGVEFYPEDIKSSSSR